MAFADSLITKRGLHPYLARGRGAQKEGSWSDECKEKSRISRIIKSDPEIDSQLSNL
jgi:hypothetical protein